MVLSVTAKKFYIIAPRKALAVAFIVILYCGVLGREGIDPLAATIIQ